MKDSALTNTPVVRRGYAADFSMAPELKPSIHFPFKEQLDEDLVEYTVIEDGFRSTVKVSFSKGLTLVQKEKLLKVVSDNFTLK